MIEYKLKIVRPALIASLMLGVGIIVVFFSEYHAIQMSKLAISIHDARYEVVRLQSAVVNTQSAQRGYLLTNNMLFIKNYEAGLNEIHQSLHALEHNALDTLEIATVLTKVKKQINQHLDHLEAGIQIGMNSGAYSPHLSSAKVAVDSAEVISHELALLDNTLKQKNITIHNKIHRTLKIEGGVATLLVMSIIFILFSGYRRTVELFEMAVKAQKDADTFSHDAYHDTLTRLPNRRYFDKYFKNVVVLASKTNQTVALLFIDLDGFKRINDLYGHDVGDAALQHFARKLKPILRGTDFMARLGGDEFAIVIQQNVDLDALYALGKRIIFSLESTFEVDGNVCKMGASIGVSLYPKHGATVDELITAADNAMYKAKYNGKNTTVFA